MGMQYLEAIRLLKEAGFRPDRDIYLTFVPDEEIGGNAGVGAFVKSEIFKKLNIGLVLDEGLASPGDEYRLFYGERSPWWTVIRAKGMPGHGAKLYDGSAMENLLKSIEVIKRFRTAQFDLVKAGIKAEGDVVSINFVYLKAGTPTPTVSCCFVFLCYCAASFFFYFSFYMCFWRFCFWFSCSELRHMLRLGNFLYEQIILELDKFSMSVCYCADGIVFAQLSGSELNCYAFIKQLQIC